MTQETLHRAYLVNSEIAHLEQDLERVKAGLSEEFESGLFSKKILALEIGVKRLNKPEWVNGLLDICVIGIQQLLDEKKKELESL